jgi:hypothetical protein
MANSAPPQNYDNHRKFVPAFHYVATPLLLVYLIYSGHVNGSRELSRRRQ